MANRSLDYVKWAYGVPVHRGMRVTAIEDPDRRQGVVTCGWNQYVRVRLDGDKRSGIYHPLSLDYGDGIDHLARHNAAIADINRRLKETQMSPAFGPCPLAEQGDEG